MSVIIHSPRPFISVFLITSSFHPFSSLQTHSCPFPSTFSSVICLSGGLYFSYSLVFLLIIVWAIYYTIFIQFQWDYETSGTSGGPHYIPLYCLTLRQTPTKNIPWNRHHLGLQGHTCPVLPRSDVLVSCCNCCTICCSWCTDKYS